MPLINNEEKPDIEKLWQSFNLSLGQQPTHSQLEELAGVFSAINLGGESAWEFARHYAQRQINRETDLHEQRRNDQEKRRGRSPRNVSGVPPQPYRSPRGPIRSKNGKRSKSPLQKMFDRFGSATVGANSTQYRKMPNEGEEEEFHDARSIPSPIPTSLGSTFVDQATTGMESLCINKLGQLGLEDTTNRLRNVSINSSEPFREGTGFTNSSVNQTVNRLGNMSLDASIQFSMGTSPLSKKPSSPGKSKNRRNKFPKPGATVSSMTSSDMSFSDLGSPECVGPATMHSTQTEGTAYANHQPSIPIQQSKQQQANQKQEPQTKQGRRKLTVKRPTGPAKVTDPVFSPAPEQFPTDALYGTQGDTPDAASAGASASAARLFSGDSPKTPLGTPVGLPNVNAPPSVPQTCLKQQKVRNTDTPFPVPESQTAPIPEAETLFCVDVNLGKRKENNRGRAFRRGLLDPGGRVQPSNTEDIASTSSVTDKSPSNFSSASTGEMSWSQVISPPPLQTQATATRDPFQQPSFAVHAMKASVPVTIYQGTDVSTNWSDTIFTIGAGDSPERKAHRNTARRKPGVSRGTMQLENTLHLKFAQVMDYRDRAKAMFQANDYRSCIQACTDGIQVFRRELVGVQNTDLMGILYSNRAAALMMVGAYEASIDDCNEALLYVSKPMGPLIHSDCSPTMVPKLYNRRARAKFKLGDLDGADADFEKSLESANAIKAFCSTGATGNYMHGLENESSVAMNGKIELENCRNQIAKLKGFNSRNNSESWLSEALETFNTVLSLCPGSYQHHFLKVELLSNMKRWRELIRHCERYASGKVKLDYCYPGDLTLKYPFPGVLEAKNLSSDAFDGVRDDDVDGITFKLSSRTKSEVVQRLAHNVMPYFVRALRLQEDYEGAKTCLAALEKLVDSKPALRDHFMWLPHERSMTEITEIRRRSADELFQQGSYEQAAQEYLSISHLLRDCGGRVNAVMHCNRAACLMAMGKHHQALSECSKAMEIHPRYMKALLRRARCNTRIERYDEAVADYQRYIDYVKRAKAGDTGFIRESPLIFEGPHQVESEQVEKATEELHEALNLKKEADAEATRRECARQKWQSERFTSNAESRREQFYQSDSRPWDSFTNRGPRAGAGQARGNQSRAANRDTTNHDNARNNGRNCNQASVPHSPRHAKDHYGVLQVSRQATASQIKKAYRQLVLKFHPDKRPDDPNAAENFHCIQDAYETLTHPEQRRQYDRQRRVF